jgi:hypothetical protein
MDSEQFELVDRQHVFEDIDLEREYQDKKYGPTTFLTAEHAMIAIQHQLDQWHSAETLKDKNRSYLQAIQVAAIAVNYLEGLDAIGSAVFRQTRR